MVGKPATVKDLVKKKCLFCKPVNVRLPSADRSAADFVPHW